MISRYEAVLNGVPLSSISADILILDIKYTQAAPKFETYSVAKRQGARVRRQYFEKAAVTISFEIHTYDIMERQRICGAVQQWAGKGGVLQTNDREGQRLKCVCSQFPTITSALKWTEALSVTFQAYSQPFWEELVPSVISLSGTSDSGHLWVPGSVSGALVEVDVVPADTLTAVWLGVNGRTMTLSGFEIAAGSTLSVTYDDDLIQSIKVGSTSYLSKRTGVDDLYVNCGESNAFGCTATVSVDTTFRVRGLWA